MENPEIRGVVRAGQVVLAEPLAVPDGTEVVVLLDEPAGEYDAAAMRSAVLAFVSDPELRSRLEADPDPVAAESR